MCLRVDEFFAGCRHTKIKDTKCQEADEVTNWSAIFCPHCELTHLDSSGNCGIGGYYCSETEVGKIMDDIHKLHDHATKLIVWAQHQYDLADKHVETLNRIFDQVNLPLNGRLQHKDMIRAMQDRRAKEVQCARANYRARQLYRKIESAIHWYNVLIPTAIAEGNPAPPLLFPVDETWMVPTPSTAMPSQGLSTTPSTAMPSQGLNSMSSDAGNPNHLLPSNDLRSNPVFQSFTIEEDLGSLATGAWLEKPTLDNLPIGQFTGDRTSAITLLARRELDALRKQNARFHAQAMSPEPAETAPSRKRKRTTCDSHVRQPAMTASEAEDASLTVTTGRTRRSVPAVNYNEQLTQTSSESGEDASAGSIYGDEQSAPNSLAGSTMIGTMSPNTKHDQYAGSAQLFADNVYEPARQVQPSFSHAHGMTYGYSPAMTTTADSTVEQDCHLPKKGLDGTSDTDLEALFDNISYGSFFTHMGYGT